jgi:hypothetical protein
VRRVGIHKVRYEAHMQILGTPVYLGSYEYRREAIAAEEVALTIRKALERATTIKRHKEQSKQIEFIVNETQSEAA